MSRSFRHNPGGETWPSRKHQIMRVFMRRLSHRKGRHAFKQYDPDRAEAIALIAFKGCWWSRRRGWWGSRWKEIWERPEWMRK